MGFRADPAGKTVGTEPVRRHVEGFLVGIAGSGLRIEAQQRGVRARNEHVRVGDVPLAFPIGAVAGRAEIVAERRHGVGVEPEDFGVAGFLGPAVGLADPVQRGVVAGQEACSRRRAGGRRRVVARELDPIFAQQVLGREMLVTECLEGLGLVDRREAHLIAQDDQEVRPFASRRARLLIRMFGLRSIGFGPGRQG